MKCIFYRRIITSFVLLCLITSCQTTGNLVLVKRKNLNEILIKNASFAEKTNEKLPLKTKYQDLDISKIISDKNTDENLFASLDSRFISISPDFESVLPDTQLTNILPDTINTSVTDTNHKNINNSDTASSNSGPEIDTRKISSLSVISLIVSSLTTSFSVFTLINYYFFKAGSTAMVILGLILPLLGYFLVYLGKKRIKKNDTKYKGMKISNAAYYISLIPYGIIALFYLIFYLFIVLITILWIIEWI